MTVMASTRSDHSMERSKALPGDELGAELSLSRREIAYRRAAVRLVTDSAARLCAHPSERVAQWARSLLQVIKTAREGYLDHLRSSRPGLPEGTYEMHAAVMTYVHLRPALQQAARAAGLLAGFALRRNAKLMLDLLEALRREARRSSQ